MTVTRDFAHENAIALALETWVSDFSEWKYETGPDSVYEVLQDMDTDRAMFTPDYQQYDEEELRHDAALIWEWIDNGGRIRKEEAP